MARAVSTAPAPPRRRRILPAVVVAIVVGGVGATFAVDVVSVQTAGHSLIWPYRTIARHLRSTHWSQTSVVVTGAVTAAVGLLLLLSALVPGRRKLLAVRSDAPDTTVGMPARSVRRALSNAALAVDGVSAAETDLGRSRADIRISTKLRDPGDLAAAVRSAVTTRLEELSLERPPTIRVRLRSVAPPAEASDTLPSSGPTQTRDGAPDTSGTTHEAATVPPVGPPSSVRSVPGTAGATTPGATAARDTTPGDTEARATAAGDTTPGASTPGATTPGATTPGATTPGATSSDSPTAAGPGSQAALSPEGSPR